MDKIIGLLKDSSNTAENHFSNEIEADFQSKMMNYFMMNSKKISLLTHLSYDESKVDASESNDDDYDSITSNTDEAKAFLAISYLPVSACRGCCGQPARLARNWKRMCWTGSSPCWGCPINSCHRVPAEV